MRIKVSALFFLHTIASLCAGSAWANVTISNQKSADLLYDEAMLLVDKNNNTLAIELLQQVVEIQPDYAGAWLDLALLNCRVGNSLVALDLLELIKKRFDPAPPLLLVISKIQNMDCGGPSTPGKPLQLTEAGSLQGEFSIGLDDNVNQGLNNNSFFFNQGGNLIELQVAPDFRPRSDEFVQADLNYRNKGLNAYLQLRENSTENEFNLLSGYVGFQTQPRLADLNLQFGTLAGALTLGGALYQTTFQLNTQITPAKLQILGASTRIAAAISRVNYPSLSGAEAELFDLGLENTWYLPSFGVATRIDYALDNSLKNRAGGDRSSIGYSVDLIKPLNNSLTFRLGLAQRQTVGENLFSPGIFDEKRVQNRTSYSLALSKPLNRSTTLKLQVRKTSNQENIRLFEYDNTVARFSLLWDFN